MSLNVLVIAEDYRLDQYILKPLVSSLLDEAGKPNATVEMCRDPFITGVDQALDTDQIEDVIRTNPLVDLYLLLVDRDGDDNEKSDQLREREAFAGEILRRAQRFLGGQAHQEVEVWLLAAHDDLPSDWNWSGVRSEPNAKETYYRPYAARKGVGNKNPANGREPLGQDIPSNYSRVRQLCDEVRELEERVAMTVT